MEPSTPAIVLGSTQCIKMLGQWESSAYQLYVKGTLSDVDFSIVGGGGVNPKFWNSLQA